MIDFDRYLKRIQYKGNLLPTKENLFSLQSCHLQNVPFENLDIHYGRTIHLSIHSFYHKIVNLERGGFCYELNGLFYELLQHLGYSVRMISTRGWSESRSDFGDEFDHLAILAFLEGETYIVDVGFGAFTFEPLRFVPDVLQHDPNGTFLIEEYDEEYFLVLQVRDHDRIPEYRFTTKARKLSDFEERCDYHQNHPDSHFKKKKIISKQDTKIRITVTEDMFKISEKGLVLKEVCFRSEEEFKEAVQMYFNIELDKIFLS